MKKFKVEFDYQDRNACGLKFKHAKRTVKAKSEEDAARKLEQALTTTIINPKFIEVVEEPKTEGQTEATAEETKTTAETEIATEPETATEEQTAEETTEETSTEETEEEPITEENTKATEAEKKFSETYKKNAERMYALKTLMETARDRGDRELERKYRKEYTAIKSEIDMYALQIINQW